MNPMKDNIITIRTAILLPTYKLISTAARTDKTIAIFEAIGVMNSAKNRYGNITSPK